MATPNWFLEELSHAGCEHVDANYVTTYDQKAGTDPTADVDLLRELGLDQDHILVDMGAGTAETEQLVETWLGGAAASSDAGWTRAELETHLRKEHSTFHWLLEPMLTKAGFKIQEIVTVATRVYTSYTCTKEH